MSHDDATFPDAGSGIRSALTGCAVFLLTAVAAFATDVEISLRDLAQREAYDDVTCSSPGIGNQCLIVTCAGCGGAIPDQGEYSRTIDITAQDLAGVGIQNCTINRVNFALELTHSDVGDLRAILGHGATEVYLYDPPSACNATSVDAIFSDQGVGQANACPASGGSTFLPDEPLHAFASQPVIGDWTLTVADLLALDSGMVDRWRFAIDASCQPLSASSCTPGPNTLCLGAGDRFKVEADFETRQAVTGKGKAVELTPDTGYLWFFNQENVEVVIKALNGCGINNRYWVFAGGLTDVRVVLRVTDTKTGQPKTYFNSQQTPFAPIQDTSAFATCP